jgi:hypothetical protein
VLEGASLRGTRLEGVDLSYAIWTDGSLCAKGSRGRCKKAPWREGPLVDALNAILAFDRFRTYSGALRGQSLDEGPRLWVLANEGVTRDMPVRFHGRFVRFLDEEEAERWGVTNFAEFHGIEVSQDRISMSFDFPEEADFKSYSVSRTESGWEPPEIVSDKKSSSGRRARLAKIYGGDGYRLRKVMNANWEAYQLCRNPGPRQAQACLHMGNVFRDAGLRDRARDSFRSVCMQGDERGCHNYATRAEGEDEHREAREMLRRLCEERLVAMSCREFSRWYGDEPKVHILGGPPATLPMPTEWPHPPGRWSE